MPGRKVVLKMVLSLDGFATSPDGTHEWMFRFFGDDGSDWNLRALEQAGTHAMGRRSYEIMGPHWQASQGPVADAMNDKPKLVFSRDLGIGDWGPVEFAADPSEAIGREKAREDGGTVLVHGGPDLAASLVGLGLIDEFQLTWIPLAIGAGRSPFEKLDEHLELELVDERRFDSGARGEILVHKT